MSGERRIPGACYPTSLTSQWAPELVRTSVSKGKWRVTKEFTLHGLLAFIYVCALAYICAQKKRVTVMDAEASSMISNLVSLGTSSKDPRGTCSNGKVRVAKWQEVWPFALFLHVVAPGSPMSHGLSSKYLSGIRLNVMGWTWWTWWASSCVRNRNPCYFEHCGQSTSLLIGPIPTGLGSKRHVNCTVSRKSAPLTIRRWICMQHC